MASEKDILVSNYIEAAKLAQRSIYVSCLASVSIALILYVSPEGVVTIPGIDLKTSGSSAFVATIGVYLVSGIMCLFAVLKCLEIKRHLSGDREIIRALNTYPSVIHTQGLLRLIALLLPWFILNATLTYNPGASKLWSFVFTFPLSGFHIAALVMTYLHEWRDFLYGMEVS